MSCAAGSAYTYDGDGSRVEKTGGGATPTLYWDGLAESDLSGNVTSEYIFLGGRRIARRDVATGSVYYYFQDMLNSSNVVATSAGGVENESDFYPFGGESVVTQNLANQKYKFTGKERDAESGNDYFGARYYASSMGRFMSPDKPFADQHSGNPQSWNLYSYTRNNPLRFVDDDGEKVNEAPTVIVTYHVSGSTAAEAWNNAPAASGISGGYRGNTETNIGVGNYTFDYSYKTSGTTTTVTDTLTSADVNLSVTITLPTWDGYSSASPAEQKQWDSLAGGLKEHEDGHKTIAEQGAAALDKSLPGTTGTGTGNSLPGAQKSADAALGQQVSDKHQDAVTTTQKNQDSYDSRTNHGAQPDPQKKPN